MLPPKIINEDRYLGNDKDTLSLRGVAIYVPRDSVGIYQRQWDEYKEQIVGYDFN
jgi:protein involved in sex pheromone biosynthesis